MVAVALAAQRPAKAKAPAARRSPYTLSRAAVWVVVLGLITVLLAGMLLPGLGRAREEARRI